MSYKYIIMCGGDYGAWVTTRQLAMFNGEHLVERTIRLLRENGIEDISISSNNEGFDQFGVPVLHHDNDYITTPHYSTSGIWCNAFYPTDVPTCYVFGDVFFSPAAIKTIVETETDDIAFFGSAPPFGKGYPKPWIEPFAFKVVNNQHLRQACEDVKRLRDLGRFWRDPIAWEVWNVISRGPDGDVNFIDYSSYIHINDYTCDIDGPEDMGLLPPIERMAKNS